MPKPEIIIYYAEVCGLCHKAMDFFRSRNYDFNAYEIGYDGAKDEWLPSENLERLEKQIGKFDFVPQIFINGTHIAGWKKLEPMIENGEFDALLKQ
ncbi:glutaredoxin domain-containing protein [Kiritimatiellaeota bacterium B1221]|nr:glutaredoxin domain-containing protein [Kiritimatiellaeota bacterium B1221]